MQLRGAIGELEVRRDRLIDHLSELNCDILSSITVSGGAAPSRSRMRRRVSDFVRAGEEKALEDKGRAFTRRVFSSTLVRTEEDSQSPGSSNIGYELLKAANTNVAIERETVQSLKAELELLKTANTNVAVERENVQSLRAELATAQQDLAEMNGLRRQVNELQRRLGDESSKRSELQRVLEIERENTHGQDQELRLLKAEVGDLRNAATKAKEDRKQEALRKLNLPTPSSTSTGVEMSRAGSLKEYRLDPVTSDPVPFSPRGKSKDKEQVERLRKVVEGQSMVISALKDDVARWREVSVMSNFARSIPECCLNFFLFTACARTRETDRESHERRRSRHHPQAIGTDCRAVELPINPIPLLQQATSTRQWSITAWSGCISQK